MTTLMIESRYGWLPAQINGVSKELDLLAVWWRLKAIHEDTQGQPPETGFLPRVAALVEELGFGRVTQEVATLFAAGVSDAVKAARAGEGTAVEGATVDEVGKVAVEFARVVDLANLGATELPPVPPGFVRRTVGTTDGPSPGQVTVTYRDEPPPPPPAE